MVKALLFVPLLEQRDRTAEEPVHDVNNNRRRGLISGSSSAPVSRGARFGDDYHLAIVLELEEGELALAGIGTCAIMNL